MATESISILEATVLGIVQGLTEFLPISSSAHLRVVPTFIGWGDPGAAYSAVLQLGSVAALLAYFARQITSITLGFVSAIKEKDYQSSDFKLFTGIIIGTAPICIIGLAIKSLLEQKDSPLRSLELIATVSIVMGLLLVVAEVVGNQKKNLKQMGIKDGFIVGLGQALALIPGCSRSGSTLTVAMLLGLNRADAARFSFLLGIPAVVLSGLLELKELFEIGIADIGIPGLICGLIASTVVSYLAIAWMIKFLEKHSTWWFVVYRVLFGAFILYALKTGLIS
ncbi:MAG: undecaprenyl-diphosphate phosphatase [Candidatus Obscuribacterales bacterium]|nr:undecaprenyl-diphosphate phosphatase [Cyanobacteria bacterium HKST-UBA01]MCB9468300.1 undecaprenyl-diphosphate phosphatase [Candidatus Obscuribacterales bacterium]